MNAREKRDMNLLAIRTIHEYCMCEWSQWDYSILKYITWLKRAGRGTNRSYNDCIIMGDTETSKKHMNEVCENHVVAWTISIRAYEYNIVTLYGHRPSEFVMCLDTIMKNMSGHDTIVYFHNLAYDWVFLRKFLFKQFGFPDHQLNTKSHYPIKIEWEESGLILKDSLILGQRGLEKWGKDMNVQHQKASGYWDYDRVRNQDEIFSDRELEYIEHDTLCGVECINALMNALNKHLYSIPYTATGIPREEVRKRGKANKAKNAFMRKVVDYDQQMMLESLFHGGYVHANRGCVGWIQNDVICYDFASSYPYSMLAEKYPMERFTEADDCSLYDILNAGDEYAFIFKLTLVKVELKDWDYPMPALQLSKCVRVINEISDNGRIMYADLIEIFLNEVDLSVIEKIYSFEREWCSNVYYSMKDYLPRWLTDYVFELFTDKTMLKGTDDLVSYNLAKSKLNSVYGMVVQKPIKQNIKEDWESGEYWIDELSNEDLYQKYVDNHNSILNFQWGCYVTSWSFAHVFELGKCCDEWIYTDTDSCYGIGWHQDQVDAYNEKCKQKLRDNGYGAVVHNDREYWLGVAEFDGSYSEFVTLGCKRYCGRSEKDGELHITVAGVPKSGAKCLHDDINNFKQGLIFPGTETGKKTHTHIFVDDIYIDENGNECGDSIDLSACDYLLDQIEIHDLSELLEPEEGKTYEYNTELLLQYY